MRACARACVYTGMQCDYAQYGCIHDYDAELPLRQGVCMFPPALADYRATVRALTAYATVL